MASLSPRALELLAGFKRKLLAAHGVPAVDRREETEALIGREVLALSPAEAAEVHEASRQMEAKAYANWAAQRCVEMLKGKGLNAYRELADAEFYYRKRFNRAYLVQAGWVEHAYQAALRLASCSRKQK